MKAVLLDKPGPPSSLRIGEISIPRPGVDEALVRVCATSLNPVDYKVAAQGYEGWNYPHVLGVDVAGVIETLGEGVDFMESWGPGFLPYHLAQGRILRGIQCCSCSHVRPRTRRNLLR
jgi:NADPH:quinone reductase-like Zn-dependent oxidoreductase